MKQTKTEELFKRGVEAPAEVLERTIAAGLRLNNNASLAVVSKKSKDYWHMLGPVSYTH